MRDFIVTILALLLIVAGVKIIMLDIRVYNAEQAIKRCEFDYQVIAEENSKLRRINEQNIHLLAQGGWDALVSTDTTH